MKKTVKGKSYDTVEMSVVKKVTCGAFGDPAGYEETLYVASRRGRRQTPDRTEDAAPAVSVRAAQTCPVCDGHCHDTRRRNARVPFFLAVIGKKARLQRARIAYFCRYRQKH